MTPELREKCINTVRFLSADAIEAANSGHPGAPMGLADIGFVLWNKFLRYNPQDTTWINRDRFVLSGGHASMLLYSQLHLAGYDLSLEAIKQFRQWGQPTPGHPEYGLTPGVECTTGPLGNGFGNAVGMALGLKMLASRFNTPQHPILDGFVYTLCGDGDIQEGISAEAASLAGHLKLENLVVIYDYNNTSITGDIVLTMNEDVGGRFEACGWYVQHCDGHNHEELEVCIQNAKDQLLKPSLIIAQTILAKGAPNKAGDAAAHGAPLGKEEVRQAKEALGWPQEPTFFIPDDVRDVYKQRTADNIQTYNAWQALYQDWRTRHPALAKLWDDQMELKMPDNLFEKLIASVEGHEGATRQSSQLIIQEAARLIPSMIGGSADLEPSTLTLIKGAKSIVPASVQSNILPDPSFSGRNIHFGIREHAMGAITSGIYLAGGWFPFCSTFLVFSDYMRASIRLAALSKIPAVYVFTHDSFWVGEDGPTHQPIEQISSLRLIPNLNVWRPSDGLETAVVWAYALERPDGNMPSALILTRQGVKNLKRAANFDPKVIWKGGYVLTEASKTAPQITLISTGSEGSVVQTVRENLEEAGYATSHVSMPCVKRFKAQSAEYQESVLPKSSLKIAVEAGSTEIWYQCADHVIGIDQFGNAAPGNVLAEKYGFTADQITSKVKKWAQE
ncbi:MAG: transketolase [SAR324 cluster bacterium]|nr:transketolase [SAR324 cluster bacterium]